MFDILSRKLEFNYTYRYARDGNWGAKDPITGEWNGMLREINDGVSDLCGIVY